MDRRTVEIEIAGRSLRVVSSAPPDELKRLAAMVAARVPAGSRGRPPAEAMLLAAVSLAHDLEDERNRRAMLERRTRDLLRRVLIRLDDALEPGEGEE